MNYWHHHGHHHQRPPESSWGRYSCITPPSGTVVALDDAKNHLRVTGTDDDSYITTLINVGTAAIDGPSGIGIAMMNQTWSLTLERLPLYFQIGLGPVSAINSITYLDSSATLQTVDPTLYRLISGTQPAQVFNTFIPPDYLKESIQVTFTCGYGASKTNVPADLRQAVLLFVSHFYDVREIAAPTLRVQEIPFSVRAILDRYRVSAIA